MTEPSKHSRNQSVTERVVTGALIGALVGVLVVGTALGIAEALKGKNEGNSGAFSVLVWIVAVPLMMVTLAPLWIDHVRLAYVAMPWYLGLVYFMPETMAISVGFVVNSAFIGAGVAYAKQEAQRESGT